MSAPPIKWTHTMDAHLLSLAQTLRLSDGGFCDQDPPLTPNWATGWKVKTMIDLLPHLYERTTARTPKTSRSSYGLKHDLEHLFQTYAPELSSLHGNWVGNGELILAMAYLNYTTYSRSGLNAFYYLKDKRRGRNNKGGKFKTEADTAEAVVRELLRKQVADHS